MGFGFDFMWNVFPVIFLLTFVLILGTFLVTAARGLFTWNKNNQSPRLTVSATVVTKRSSVSHHHHHNGHNHMSHTAASTSYYATFQFESGDRQEFRVDGQEYGLLAEGDHGQLTFQGTRFLSFERF